MCLQIIFVFLSCAVLSPVTGYDMFEGLLPGAPCIPEARPPTGCNGKLVDEFIPKTRGVDINKPDTLFYLFTAAATDKAEFLHDCGGRLPENSKFDRRLDTEIIVHGWLDGVCRTAWMREIKDQLFIRDNYNVILVDWTWGNIPDYYGAGANSPVVGEQLAFVLQNIIDKTMISVDRIHIIGHSLGAHIAGFAGKRIPGIRRITGLDPALAPFQNSSPEERLSEKDANLVDIIHSNGGECFPTSIGDARSLGHADFYPNGGFVQQPSCLIYAIQSFLKLDALYATFSLHPVICHHLQSIQFYKVSINPDNCQFVGVESSSYQTFQASGIKGCRRDGSNCAVMGMDFEEYYNRDGAHHKYYLNTGQICPYCDNTLLRLNGFPPEKRRETPVA